MAQPQQTDTLDTVSGFLLTNAYLLTALELFQESLERGKVVPQLQTYFSQPDFVAIAQHSISTHEHSRRKRKIDPLVEQDYQKRIKTLEYDLRLERQSL